MALRPIILIEDNPDDGNVVIDSYNLGANSYVRKPVEIEKFTEAVRQLGLYWAVINETDNRSRGVVRHD
jgi:two-component system response regulator